MQDILDGLSADPLISLDWYLDLETGEAVLIGDHGAIDPAGDPIELDTDSDRYEPIPRSSGKSDYALMRQFAEDVPDGALRERLAVALDGRGAFGRFRRVLRGYPELQAAWYRQLRSAHIAEATQWLETLGIEPVYELTEEGPDRHPLFGQNAVPIPPPEQSDVAAVGAHASEQAQRLLERLHHALPKLRELLAASRSHWGYEDPICGYYQQSHKLYGLQEMTLKIVRTLAELRPLAQPLDAGFMAIVEEGTSKGSDRATSHKQTSAMAQQQRWAADTRPIAEAFFHARFFLEMAVAYGQQLKQPPSVLPSGWAALLHLYGLR